MTFHLKSTSKWWWWCLNEQIAQRLSYSIIVFGLSSKWRWCQNETILYTRRAYGNSAGDSELFYGKRWLSMFPHIQCWLVHTLSVVCATIFWLVVCSIYDKLSDPVGIHRFSAESLRSSPAHSQAFVIFSGILFKACPWCAMSEVFYFFFKWFLFHPKRYERWGVVFFCFRNSIVSHLVRVFWPLHIYCIEFAREFISFIIYIFRRKKSSPGTRRPFHVGSISESFVCVDLVCVSKLSLTL